jgi:hypothetical protein
MRFMLCCCTRLIHFTFTFLLSVYLATILFRGSSGTNIFMVVDDLYIDLSSNNSRFLVNGIDILEASTVIETLLQKCTYLLATTTHNNITFSLPTSPPRSAPLLDNPGLIANVNDAMHISSNNGGVIFINKIDFLERIRMLNDSYFAISSFLMIHYNISVRINKSNIEMGPPITMPTITTRCQPDFINVNVTTESGLFHFEDDLCIQTHSGKLHLNNLEIMSILSELTSN